MNRASPIIEIAKSLGVSTAAVIKASSLHESPSHRTFGRAEFNNNTKSVIVFGLHHGEDELYLDWWGGEGHSPGNRKMEKIAEALIEDLRKELNMSAFLLPYHVKRGGVFLKDAAVLASLGTIGKNNLVITPEFGPRIRWRALGLDRAVTCSEAESRFDPCTGCDMPCLRSCPQGAFAEGAYSKESCMQQMKKDESDRFVPTEDQANTDSTAKVVKYCRVCELTCPIR